MQPHTICDVGYLTVDERHSDKNLSDFRRLTYWLLSGPVMQNFDSSENIVLRQNSSGLSTYSLAHFRRAASILTVSSGFLRGLLAASPAVNSLLRTVTELQVTPDIDSHARFSLVEVALRSRIARRLKSRS